MAPLTRRREIDPVIHPADRLSRLPDEILAQILSFLPAQEAVRTCVLARTWRDIWKLMRRLLITGGKGEGNSVKQEFVDGLLRFRLDGLEYASLHTCEIMSHNDYGVVHRWIRLSLECQVQVLRVEEAGTEGYLQMSDMRLIVSRHLTRLELCGVWFDCIDLDLDGCPALEHLEISECYFACVSKITSPSLQRLVITRCESNVDRPRRFRICAPCLVSLWLEVARFRAPLLDRMPELVEAYVRIDKYWDDDCYCVDPMGCYHVMQAAHILDGNVDCGNENGTADYTGCVLLQGLAQAKGLVLLSHQSMYIFRRDLRMCPTFSNLKTLVLNGYWCEPADCRPLACILEHAPVLENLTVIFSEEVELKYGIVMEGRPDATAGSTMANQCLKTIKVKCHTVDEGVQNVLKFLSTLNICFNSE